MAEIPIQAGAVVQMVFRSDLCGQRVLNTFYYRLSSILPFPSPDYRGVLNEMADQFDAVGGMRDKYIAACPTNMNIQTYTLQPVWPIRQRYLSYNVATAGLATTGSTNTANIAASIKRVSDVIGPKGVGRVQIPATKNGVANGMVDPAYIAADLLGLADQMPLGITTAAGYDFRPILFSVNEGVTSTTEVIDTVVEDTARVMRRRTVRLGI